MTAGAPDMLTRLMEPVATGLELVGVAAILIGVVVATIKFAADLRGPGRKRAYDRYRANLGRGILLGLEFLVGADILKSLVTPHELQDLLGLALLMVARTFLSVSLSVEINGHWPWQETRLSRERSAGGAT